MPQPPAGTGWPMGRERRLPAHAAPAPAMVPAMVRRQVRDMGHAAAIKRNAVPSGKQLQLQWLPVAAEGRDDVNKKHQTQARKAAAHPAPVAAPKTNAQRVRESEARAIAKGARRMPAGLLTPEAAQALESLQRRGYGASACDVIRRALIQAAKR